jgi:hypothetical protein
MTKIRSAAALLLFFTIAACGNSTGPGGDPNGNLDVEFRNFTATIATMGETGKSTVDVVGNGSDGNPTIYKVVNPGIGKTLSFTASWGSQNESVTCTVTDITGISVPPTVVIQPIGVGYLDCSGW